MALQAGVRFHGGVARPELVGKPLEGLRDADAQEGELENFRAEKAQNYRVTIPGDEPGATTKFFKLMVQ
ncbi:hypothetical protein OAH51_01465 [Verrucomicrobia bacterium]|nr:hypothetical protein [Verrucomicrobiota bacterium]